MIPLRLLIDAGAVFLSAGIFLTLYNLFITTTEIILRFWRKTFISWAGRRLQGLGILQEKPYRAQVELDWKRLLAWLVIPLLALTVQDVMLSPLVLLIGLAIHASALQAHRGGSFILSKTPLGTTYSLCISYFLDYSYRLLFTLFNSSVNTHSSYLHL